MKAGHGAAKLTHRSAGVVHDVRAQRGDTVCRTIRENWR
jgi:hypothetical protein